MKKLVADTIIKLPSFALSIWDRLFKKGDVKMKDIMWLMFYIVALILLSPILIPLGFIWWIISPYLFMRDVKKMNPGKKITTFHDKKGRLHVGVKKSKG